MDREVAIMCIVSTYERDYTSHGHSEGTGRTTCTEILVALGVLATDIPTDVPMSYRRPSLICTPGNGSNTNKPTDLPDSRDRC